MAKLDDDAAAGQQLFDQLTSGNGGTDMPTVTVTAPKPTGGSAPTQAELDAAQGQDFYEKLLKQQQADAAKPPPVPTAQEMLDAKMGLTGIRKAFAIAPDEYHYGGLGALLPVREDAQGKMHMAIPQAVKTLGNGVLDLIQGPTTGNVTQDARAALLTAALSGRANPFREAARNAPPPTVPLTEDIQRARAYDLWEKAGRPEGQDQQFWQQAGKPQPMPQPDANMMSPATSKFVDLLYHYGGMAVGSAIGGAIDHVTGMPFVATGLSGVAGALAHNQAAALLQSLLPEQRAAAIANMTARYGAGAVSRIFRGTIANPGMTPDSNSAKLPYVPASPPQQNPLIPQGMPFA